MSAHAIVAQMRSELRAYRRRHRSGDQAVEHETKDTFCAAFEGRLNDLARAIGTPETLSLRVGEIVRGRRVVSVVTRDRVPAENRAPKRREKAA
ncbi:MAG: hypothetical protein WAP03_21940 [Methylorubrum rhodinum]|uniref:hypothetical protein n=1 Tax=Methylorubrum rhodinum TaxID=29428 RepID=UPI003BAF852B